MKKLLLFMLFLISVQPAASAAFTESDCFDNYEFSTGIKWADFYPDMKTYAQGDVATFSYTVMSVMKAPVVEGRERVQIFYDSPQRGEELVDEFFAPGRVDLMEDDSARRTFTWKIPDGAPEGSYTAKIYFIVGNMFNLAGLSLVTYGPPGVPGETTSFYVGAGNASYLYFDKSETRLASDTYDFGEYVPIMQAGYPPLHTTLASVGGTKNAKVTMELYAWDDLSGTPVSTEEKTIAVGDAPVSLDYNLPALNPNSYEVRMTATAGGEKAMLKIRFGVSGSRGRYNYAGLTDFPLKAGQQAVAFVCMANAADHESWFNGSGTFRFVDDKGDVVFEERFGPVEMPPDPYGLSTAFTVSKDVSLGHLEVKMFDADGKEVDSQRLEYDLSKFTNVGASMDLDVRKSSIAPGDDIEYTVTLESQRGRISGNVLLYLVEPDGSVLEAGEIQVNDTYSGTTTPAGVGSYTLKARETTHDLAAEADIDVREPSVRNAKADYTRAWIAAAVAVAAIAGLFIYRRFS